MTGPSQDSDGRPRRFVIAAGCGSYDHLDDTEQLVYVADEIDAMIDLAVGWGYQRVLAEVSLDPDVATVRSVFADWLTAADRRPDDVVVVYWTGHGLGDAEWQDHRLLARDSRADRRHTMWQAADLVEALADSPVRELLLIIDACYAGFAGPDLAAAASRLATTAPKTRAGGGLVVMSSARAKEEAHQAAFTHALAAAVSEAPAGFKQEWLDLLQLAKGVNDRLDGCQHVEVSTYARSDPPTFVPNPAFGTTLALPDDLLTHWDPRGRGVALAAEQGRYFTGRRRALADISAWLSEPADAGTSSLVVTGGPGSGKSAVLAQFVTRPPDDGELSSGRPTVDVAVVARKKTALEVGTELAGALVDVDTAMVGSDLAVLTHQLAGHITDRDEVATVAVDALDEATDPGLLCRGLLLPLVDSVRAAVDRPGRLRLLVGSRQPQADLIARFTDPLDLDDDRYVDVDDIARYVHKLLTTDQLAGSVHYPPDEEGEGAGWHVAVAVAERAFPTFLIARLVALSIRDAPQPVNTSRDGWQTGFPGTVGQVFDGWLARQGPDEQKVRDLLEPLAYAAGAGLAWGDIWAPIASSMSGRDYTDSDIRWLLATAGAYLTESRVHGRSVYRLYHQALADHLHDPARHRDIHVRIVAGLVEGAATGHGSDIAWDRAHPYLTDHLAEHAAAADDASLDRLVADPSYLLHANPDHLVEHLNHVQRPDAVAAAQVYQTAAHHLVTEPADTRGAYLALAAHRHGHIDLAAAILDRQRPPPPTWTPRWVAERPTTPHRILSAPHTDWVNAVAVGAGADGRPVVVSGGYDRSVRVWDLGSGRPVGDPLEGDTGPVRAVAVGAGADGRPVVVSGGDDGTVRVWDLASGRPVGDPLEGHTSSVYAVAVGAGADGRPVVVSGGDDGTVRVWDLASGRPVGDPLEGDTDSVRAVAVGAGADGRPVVVSGSDDHTVRVWDLASGGPVGDPLEGHTSWVNAVAVRAGADGRPVVVSGSSDRSVRVWDLGSGRPVGDPLEGHTGPVRAVAVGAGADGRLVVVSGSYDRSVRVWDLGSGRPVGDPLEGHTGPVRAVAVGAGADGRLVVVSGSSDGTVRVWDLAPGRPVGDPLEGHTGPVRAVAVGAGADGRLVVVSGSYDRSVRVWDLASGRPVGDPLEGHTSWVNAVAIGAGADGRPVVVSGSEDHTVRVWDLALGRPVGDPLEGHTSWVLAVAVGAGADGRPVVVSGSYDRSVRVWDLASGRPVGDPLEGHTGPVRAVAVGAGADGRPVAVSGSADGTVRMWDLASGGPVGDPLEGDTGPVRAVAVGAGADGRPVVVSGSADGTVRVWDLASGGPVGDPLEGHTGPVSAVAVGAGADGRPVVVSGSYDETVRVWDLASGRPASRIAIDVPVAAVAIVVKSNGNDVVLGTEQGLVLLHLAADTSYLGP